MDQDPRIRSAQPPFMSKLAHMTAPNPMFYATTGLQATQPGRRPGGAPGQGSGMGQGGSGGSGFPPLGRSLGRTPPPGFPGRGSDGGDFPALGSHPHTSTYASQAQTQQTPSTSTSNPHLSQQMYMQGGPGLAPPPPPPGMGTSPQQPNGMVGDGLRGEDFPALGAGGIGDGKDRLPSYMRNQPPQSPPSLANGTSNSTSATPSTNPPLPTSGAGTADSWGRHSPSRGSEPVVRPVQQILASPVDKWGLKALLYEIKTSMGKGDRGVLLFGEELSELGVDVTSEDALYPTFVTPWIEPSQLPQSVRIEESHHLPQCYNVVAPPVQTKVPNFTEDTLFFAFYTSPQDVLQLEVAEELYNRGWRYHTDLQVWLTSPTVPSAPLDQPGPNWLRGPFVVFDPRTFSRTKTADEFMVDASLLEATRPAAAIIAEEQARKDSAKSPNGSVVSSGAYGQR